MDRMRIVWQRFKYELVLLGIILFVALLTVAFLFFFTPGQGVNLDPLRNLTGLQPASIKSVTPTNGANNIDPQSVLVIVFSGSLTKEEREKVTIDGNPKIFADMTWSDNNTVLRLGPTTPLFSNRSYNITITSGENNYLWSFTTGEVKQIPLEEQIINQSRSDQKYGEYVQSINENYPWYNKLPLRTDNYFVYFSTESKRFVGVLYPDTTATTSVDQQILSMKNEINTKLENLGIDTSAYQFDWQVKSK